MKKYMIGTLQLLRDEYGQEKTVSSAHTNGIDLLAVKGVRYAKIRQCYDTLRINYEALRATRGHTKVEGTGVTNSYKPIRY